MPPTRIPVAAGVERAELPDPKAPLKPRTPGPAPRTVADEIFDEPSPKEARTAAETPAPEPANGDALPPMGRRTLNQIHATLCKPFPLWAVEVKPGATTKDKARALALAYVDPRQYQTRLDRLAGPDGWTVEYRPLNDRAVLCRLTILGVTREDVGECDAGDPNQITSATMQAFKRACAAFGLGRYLYSLPQPWVEYNQDRRQIANPQGAAEEIYRMAGLLK